MSAYVEPFAGSLAVLLKAPVVPRFEAVNDLDGLLVNFWRAVKADPDSVAKSADYPPLELDLHARHDWLRGQRESITEKLKDPEFFDAKIAGWWVWGAGIFIGGGYGFRNSHAKIKSVLSGVHGKTPVRPWLEFLSKRLAKTIVLSGDWKRVVTNPYILPHWLSDSACSAVFLDPPYPGTKAGYVENSAGFEAQKWAVHHGENPKLRIALCGYDEYDGKMPANWTPVRWGSKHPGGYGSNGKEKSNAETIWFSPHCLKVNNGDHSTCSQLAL